MPHSKYQNFGIMNVGIMNVGILIVIRGSTLQIRNPLFAENFVRKGGGGGHPPYP